MPRKENPGPLSAQQQQDLVSEGIDNFELPKSLVTKIAKSAVPESTKLQKEAILSLVKGSTVFINYLAATAHDVAQSKQHKSISASDVLKALEMIELGDLVEPLSAELQVYRDQVKPDKSAGAGTGVGAGRRASTASASVNGFTATSASTPAKAKGKDNASTSASVVGAGPIVALASSAGGGTETLPPPFTSAPLVHRGDLTGHALGDQQDSISAAANLHMDTPEMHSMDVDENQEDLVGGRDAEMEDVADQHEQEQEEQGDGELEHEAQEQELRDTVAVVEENARSVERRGAVSE
ncbi:histone-fold-containing protein [Lentinula aciculospora]|uniref:DNA polymerase epsilon subunit D n=1 Tax=Lentinula aciculospora TaxID=153920 RepID=A0A9W9DL69_9AGAR|nr:histone-fold-containing protein [Lentinula aciculospora]